MATIHRVQGQDVRMPVEIRDASVAAATFLVDAAAVRRLLAPTGLRPATMPGGRALCSVAFVDYIDGDLGKYHEVAVAFVVKPHDGRGRTAVYIHRLPVDQGFTLEAGRTIWGFPKFMSESTITDDGRTRTVDLREDGAPILTLAVRRSPVPLPAPRMSLPSYSYLDGVLRRTAWETQNDGVAVRPGGARLTLGGHHPMAEELRSLGMPKGALMSMTVRRMRATFQEPEVVASK
jgi:hypothetical protein